MKKIITFLVLALPFYTNAQLSGGGSGGSANSAPTVQVVGSPVVQGASTNIIYKWYTDLAAGNQLLLPTAVGKAGQVVSVYRYTTDNNSLSVVPNGAELINGVNAPIAIEGSNRVYNFTSDNVGWVANVPEGYVSTETGTALLATTYTTITTTYTDIGLQVILPSAGDYMVSAPISGYLVDNSTIGRVVTARFTDATGTIQYGADWSVVGRDEDNATSSSGFASGTGITKITGATAGQVIKIQVKINQSGQTTGEILGAGQTTGGQSSMTFQKTSGFLPATGATVDRVNVICRNKTAQSIPSNSWGNLTNWTEIQDPTNSFNPVTGVFTAPRTASYAFSTGNGFTVNTGNYVGQAVWLNNATQLYNFLIIAPTLAVSFIQTNGVIEMTAGQTLQARTFNGSVSAPNDTPSASNSWFTITEINPSF